MAYQKNLEMPTGVVGNYWRIGNMHVYEHEGEMVIEASIDFYKDKDASDNFKKALIRDRFRYIMKTTIPIGRAMNMNQLRAQIYTDIKTYNFEKGTTSSPFFEDALTV